MARVRGRRKRHGRHPHPTHHRVRAHTRHLPGGGSTRVKAHHRHHPRRGRRGRRGRAAAGLF